jgi:hypothetical protein
MNQQELELVEEKIKEKILTIRSDSGAVGTVDGIVDLARYLGTEKKVLYIQREPSKGVDDLRLKYREATEKVIKKDRTVNLLTKVVKEIYNHYGKGPKKYDVVESLQKTAIINIKKLAGGSKSNLKIIESVYAKNKELLIEQVKSYTPDIVIFGGTAELFKKDLMFDKKCKKIELSSKGKNAYLFSNVLFIAMYHTSAITSHKAYIANVMKAIEEWDVNKETLNEYVFPV